MLFINSSGPKSWIFEFECFRVSDSIIGRSGYILEQIIDAFQFLFIIFLPEQIVFPWFLHKNIFHSSIRFWLVVSPLLNFSIAESRRDSFNFEESSYWVAHKELYSDNDMMTTPLSLPLLMIRVSKFWVTLSKYFLMCILKPTRPARGACIFVLILVLYRGLLY